MSEWKYTNQYTQTCNDLWCVQHWLILYSNLNTWHAPHSHIHAVSMELLSKRATSAIERHLTSLHSKNTIEVMRHRNAKYGVCFCGYITTLLTSRVNSPPMLIFLKGIFSYKMVIIKEWTSRFFWRIDRLYILHSFINIRHYIFLK
jgi:hypothetical protein